MLPWDRICEGLLRLVRLHNRYVKKRNWLRFDYYFMVKMCVLDFFPFNFDYCDNCYFGPAAYN